MSAQSGKKSGGAKKIGRNGARCKIYRDRGVREKNKARKVARHIRAIERKQVPPRGGKRRDIRMDMQAVRWAA